MKNTVNQQPKKVIVNVTWIRTLQSKDGTREIAFPASTKVLDAAVETFMALLSVSSFQESSSSPVSKPGIDICEILKDWNENEIFATNMTTVPKPHSVETDARSQPEKMSLCLDANTGVIFPRLVKTSEA